MERQRHTIASAFQLIAQGVPPWLALNEVLHEWYEYSPAQRSEMIAEPVTVTPGDGEKAIRWATYCAGLTELLCSRDRIPIPEWVFASELTLAEPWFEFGGPLSTAARNSLRRTTPEPFARRNIFCGGRVLATKYEFAAQMQRSVGRDISQ